MAMQTWQLESCRVIYGSAMTAPDKLAAIGSTLGLSNGTTKNANTPRAPRKPAAAKRDGPTKKPNLKKSRAASIDTRTYNRIPETGGITRTDLRVRGVTQDQITASLAKQLAAGRLVERSGVWFRATPQQQRAA